LESDEVLPTLASLFTEMASFQSENPGTDVDEALLGIGYTDSLSSLTRSYTAYVRLERLPGLVKRAAIALAGALVVLAIVVPTETTDVIYAGDVVPRWIERLVGVIGVIAATLGVMAVSFYYKWRFELTRLLEEHA
jgi:hypothetical protein